jgi:hypothetical protein
LLELVTRIKGFSLSEDEYMEGYWRAELRVVRDDVLVILAANRRGPWEAMRALLADVRDEFGV